MRTRVNLPIFVHFFDWFRASTWNEAEFVEPMNWEAVGTSLDAYGTTEFFQRQFEYIRRLGIDNIAWQFNGQLGAGTTVPPPTALQALRNTALRIAPVYDLELTFQARANTKDPKPEFASAEAISDSVETSDMICNDLASFYRTIPRDLISRDLGGNVVIFAFGIGFNDANPDPVRWTAFVDRLKSKMTPIVGPAFKFYWSATNHLFQEHLFLKHRAHFAPWHFVLDMPQSQFSRDSVTWNFGFDNLYVRQHYGMQRVVRVDPAYVEEPAWLAAAADPSLLFIYGWNEPFESSFLFPSIHRGDLKARLAKHYISVLQSGSVPRLPKVLLIVDDLDEQYRSRGGDWHLQLLRDMLLYRMRLFAPQADVAIAEEVTDSGLWSYEGVIDVTSRKTKRLVDLINSHAHRLRLMLFDPVAPFAAESYRDRFFSNISYHALNCEVSILGSSGSVYIRDDTHGGTVSRTCKVLLWAQPSSGERLPLVIENRNSVFVNSYSNNDEVMATGFAAFYGRPMGRSILYGEGVASRRLEQSPDGAVTYNRLSRHSVNLRLPMPEDAEWFRLPPDLSDQHFRFVFGLDS
jgi:hypothetical protein